MSEENRSLQANTSDVHTPGPWRVGERNGGGIDVRGGNNFLVARVTIPSRFAHGKEYREDNAYCEGNAKLIAAAPELLYALSNMVNTFSPISGPSEETVTHALQVIKKATT